MPLGAIRPQGWLRRQLEIQARGLTGHLDEIWPDVGPNSGWLGGTGESWERGPYYLDGLLPLAYLLQDDALIAKANKYVEWTLTHQAASGALGPPTNTDWWPTMVMLKVLTQYADATGDPRVVPALTKYFTYHLNEAGQRPLHQWAVYRWADEVLSIVWLYNRTGDPRLLTLARTLHNQGADWGRHFTSFEFEHKTSTIDLALMPGDKEFSDRAMRAHGVNTSMGLKTSAVWSQISGDQTDRDAIVQALAVLDKFHGQPNGMFTADEHYAGRDPSEGTELCAVVEAMFSLEQALAVRGGVELADRLERISYNALPATLSPDMWAHQYDQQANQVLCSLQKSTLGQQRAGVEPVRPRAELRVLHGEPASGLAETRRQPLDGHARSRPRGSRVRSERCPRACRPRHRHHDRRTDGLPVSSGRRAGHQARCPVRVSAAAPHSGVGGKRHRHAQWHCG